MDLGLTNKVAFVAGSSRGIGYAIARSFAAEGAAVAITGRNSATLEDACKNLRSQMPRAKIVAIAADLTDADAIGSALDRAEGELGPIDAAVANIGSGIAPPGYQLT